MSILTRVRRTAGITLASAAMAVTLGATAHADPASTSPQQPSHLQPASSECGYQGYKYEWGIAVYDNCSPYSVEIDVSHVWGDDTYACFPPHWEGDIPQGGNDWLITWAAADGVINC